MTSKQKVLRRFRKVFNIKTESFIDDDCLASNSHARKGDKKIMVQSSQQHVASCVKGVERELGTRGLRIEAAFWAGISRSLQPRL